MFNIESKMLMKVLSHPGHVEKHNNWRGSLQAFKLCVGVSIGPLVSGRPNQPSCGLLRLGEPRCEWLLNCLGRKLSTAL